jgi:hypothetical protein
MKKIMILLLAIACISFADAMPGPPVPDLDVSFIEGGEGAEGNFEATFVCSYAEEDPTSSLMGEREIELSCTGNTCSNNYWFYKLNPCFSGEMGYIEYSRGSQVKTSENFLVTEGGGEIMVDVDSGSVEYFEKMPCCLSSVLVILLLASAGFLWRSDSEKR